MLSSIQGDATIETSINNSTICEQFNTTGAGTCTTGKDPPENVAIDTSTGSTTSGGSNPTDTPSSGGNGNMGGSGGSSSSGISGAAIGGIVAGVIVLIFLGFGFWWWRRRKNQRPVHGEKLEDTTPELPRGGHHEKPELQGSERFRHQDPSVFELKENPMKRPPAELGWNNQIAEMEGSSVAEMGSDGRR